MDNHQYNIIDGGHLAVAPLSQTNDTRKDLEIENWQNRVFFPEDNPYDQFEREQYPYEPDNFKMGHGVYFPNRQLTHFEGQAFF